LITTIYLIYPETAPTTLYSVPIIFDRNAHLVPAVVRVADILWAAAGISGLHTSSTLGPPTSVYSLPLRLVDKVGGWGRHGGARGSGQVGGRRAVGKRFEEEVEIEKWETTLDL
jgi:hypothetical protein